MARWQGFGSSFVADWLVSMILGEMMLSLYRDLALVKQKKKKENRLIKNQNLNTDLIDCLWFGKVLSDNFNVAFKVATVDSN